MNCKTLIILFYYNLKRELLCKKNKQSKGNCWTLPLEKPLRTPAPPAAAAAAAPCFSQVLKTVILYGGLHHAHFTDEVTVKNHRMELALTCR